MSLRPQNMNENIRIVMYTKAPNNINWNYENPFITLNTFSSIHLYLTCINIIYGYYQKICITHFNIKRIFLNGQLTLLQERQISRKTNLIVRDS